MKTLIICHNPISLDNNMGKTLLSLFDAFSEKNLCQLYIYPAIPNVKKCGSYFQITDKMVIENIFKFKTCGRVVYVDEEKRQSFERNQFEERAFTNKKNRREIKLLLRSLIWSIGNWYNRSLKNWIETEKPDVIFATGGVSSFFYPLVLKISKKYNLPIVTYVCDDFFFSKKKNGIISKIYYRRLKRNIRKMMLKSSTIVSICDLLSKKYNEFFDVNAVTIYTGTHLENNDIIEERTEATNISYFGNLFIGRNTALSEIGKVLDEINKERNTNFKLNIYTNTNDKGVKAVFDGIEAVSVYDFVSPEQVVDLMKDSILLMHVEGFETEDVERVRYSMSTKIPESLNSGVCLFAYGPLEDASIQYLFENDCAIVSETKTLLKERLEEALFNDKKRYDCISKAKEVVRQNHDKNSQSNKLKAVLEDAVLKAKTGRKN
ncbi:MAG: hypothetical protein J6V71_03240 [Clostridia bacterium]|nr:hypothetical protein [Clostridia bacterium]